MIIYPKDARNLIMSENEPVECIYCVQWSFKSPRTGEKRTYYSYFLSAEDADLNAAGKSLENIDVCVRKYILKDTEAE